MAAESGLPEGAISNQYAVLQKPAKPGVNTDHEAVTYLKQHAQVREVQFKALSLQNFINLVRTVKQVIPPRLQPKEYQRLSVSELEQEKVDPEKLPALLPYTASVIRPNQEPAESTEKDQAIKTEAVVKKKKVAIFVEPGVLMKHGQLLPAFEEILKASKVRDLPYEIALLASFDSSISDENTAEKFNPNKAVDRVASRVAMQQALLQEYTDIDEYYTFAHSLSAEEALYENLIMKKMMEENSNGKQVKNAGVILVNPGGQYRQGYLNFLLKRVPASQKFLDEARETMDLREIDQEIATAYEEKNMEIMPGLLKKRNALVSKEAQKGEIQKRHTGAAIGNPTFLRNLKTYWYSLRAAWNMVKPVPESIRDQVTGNVVYEWAPFDVYFPSAEARKGIGDTPLQNANVSQITMPDTSHLHLTVNPQAFAGETLGIIENIQNSTTVTANPSVK